MYERRWQKTMTIPAAALRLGNLRVGLGQEALALEHFTVASRASDPRIRYLAFLFVGQIHNRNGRLDDAERFYKAAIASIRPRRRPCTRSRSFSVVADVTPSRSRGSSSFLGQGRHVDPLWTFRLPPGQSASLQLDELRIEVMQ